MNVEKKKKVVWITWSLITAIMYIVSYSLQNEDFFINGNMVVAISILVFIFLDLFVSLFCSKKRKENMVCSKKREEEMAIQILMLFLANISGFLSVFLVIVKRIS